MNIDIICANSSPAKGRVERANKTLQDRLVKELRLAGAATLADGNALLPAFIADYNARFAKAPANRKDLHRRLGPGDNLDDAFAWKEERTLSRALTLQYDKILFILEPSEPAKAAIGKRVTVVDYPDGRLSIRYRGVELAYRTQVRQLAKAGCKKVFREVASGAKTDRLQFRRLLAVIDVGDVLMVTRFDRLARSTRDLLNTLAAIADCKAGFRSLRDTWADTTTSHGRLMLTVLGGLAEFERDLIRARTGEGRARAVARGVKMGRKPKLTPHQRAEAIKRRDASEPMRDIGKSFNVSHSTISRL